MSAHSGNGRSGSARRTKCPKKSACPLTRRIGFECLENRRLLSSVGLNAISNVTLPAGTSIMVALNGSDPGKDITFGATTSSLTSVTPTVMPQTNQSVQFNINGLGTMTFQLFDSLTPTVASHIETLVKDGIYNGDEIYRAESGLLVQGGNEVPQISNGSITSTKTINTLPSGVSSTVADQFNPDLDYAAGGELALATPGADGGGSEFFVTSAAQQNWDYTYSIFGFQTVNQAITYNGKATTVLQALEGMATQNVNGIDYLTTPVEITSANIITDTQNGVLMLRAPTGVTGSFTVTVTASDGTNTPTTQTFTVNVVANTSASGVANPWASQTPTAPASVQFLPQLGQGSDTLTLANNASTANKLSFLVSGVTAGNEVTVYANGMAVASGTVATGATAATVTSDGNATLFDGTYTLTATQTDPSVSVSYTDNNSSSRDETANVDSLSSPGTQLQVFTALAVTSTLATSATVGLVYTYTVQTNAPSGDTVTVTPGTLPAGMQFNAATQTFTWTPTIAQQNTAPAFSATVSDYLGHSVSIGPTDISILVGLTIPVNATAGGNVTVSFAGNQVVFYDNIAQATINKQTFTSTESITVICPPGQKNNVSVMLPTGSGAVLPQEVLVEETPGATGSTNNQVTMVGTSGANTFTVSGTGGTSASASDTVTANGLKTVAAVQKLTLQGGAGNDYYTLNSSAIPTTIVDTGGYNTLDFSNDAAGVTVNLGLDKGQTQSIAPWNNTLGITGIINKLIGTQYADVLTGGPAATTEIVGGLGNDTITGGSGNNILMGGGGNDTIKGGAGKNLIIAGSGKCSLYAAGSQNIIFAGTTNMDTNDQALLNLLAEGSQVSYGYSTRRLLASAARSTTRLSSPVTFQDTGAQDTIVGSGANNWFVLGKNGKVI